LNGGQVPGSKMMTGYSAQNRPKGPKFGAKVIESSRKTGICGEFLKAGHDIYVPHLLEARRRAMQGDRPLDISAAAQGLTLVHVLA
jgi:hypothetical protein